MVNPPIPRPPATRESILRGRDLFSRRNTTGNKVDCTSCHGPQAVGNGPSIVGQDGLQRRRLRRQPEQPAAERLGKYDEKTREALEEPRSTTGATRSGRPT